MSKTVYAIEGLDRLGKSTLIQGILDELGFYQVIHFSKPQKLKAYAELATEFEECLQDVPVASRQSFLYQSQSFWNSMLLATSGANIIFDRWHIGEVVYSPMYRGYSGDYVYDQELESNLYKSDNVRLILLTENFEVSRHFVDDGQSLGTIDKREEEQKRFIDAFNRSNILDKRIISVTDERTGSFRDKNKILKEALYDGV